MRQFKVIVEKHSDGYVAYPLGLKGIVVGEGDSCETALTDCQSAIRFHLETFGAEALEADPPVLDAFIAEAHAYIPDRRTETESPPRLRVSRLSQRSRARAHFHGAR